MRSHYVANILIQAEKSHMDYLYSVEYGWARTGNGFLSPELTDLPPAPNVIVEMSLCHYETRWNTNRCVCKKVELKCTEMCFFLNCQNCDLEDYSDDNVMDEISDEENL